MVAESQISQPLPGGPRYIRALQRAVGGLLEPEASSSTDIGKVLGPNNDIWAEVVTTKKGRRASVTLANPGNYGFDGAETIEVRGIDGSTPRFIVTPRTGTEDTCIEQHDITDPSVQARIADAISAIVMQTKQ